MRYTKKVQKIEKDTDPFVLQWFWDATKNYFHTINVRNFDADKIKELEKTLSNIFDKPASYYTMDDFKKIIQIYDKYMIETVIQNYQIDGIDRIFKIYPPNSNANKHILLDAKGTFGYTDSETGIRVPSYKIITMELYHRYISLGDDESIHRLSYPWLKLINRTGWENDIKYILFISELLAILIPKVQLNNVLTNPKYAYKFDLRNKPWEVNPRDNKDDRPVKNVRFNLGTQRDLDMILEAGARFYLRNNNSIYVPFTPRTTSFEKIKQNYFNSTSKKNNSFVIQ